MMHHFRLHLTHAFIALMVHGLVGLAFASGSQITLAPGAPLPELQPGQTLILEPGVHQGPWTIRANGVTIEGRGAVLTGPKDGSALRLLAPGIVVRDLTIQDAGSVADLYAPDAALWLLGCDDCRFEGIRTSATPSGFRIESSRNVTISDSVLAGEARGPGLTGYQSPGLTLRRVSVDGFLDGVYVERSDDVRIENSEVRGASRYGLHVMFGSGLRVSRSTVAGGGVGSAVMYGRDAQLDRNTVVGHEGPLAYGLLIHEMSNVTATGNVFEENTVGLLVVSSREVVAESNLLTSSGTGVLVRRTPGETSSEIVLTSNTFLSNVGDVAMDDPDASVVLLGNTFDRASNLDRDRDGISDVPLLPTSSFALLQTRQPDLSLFALSPGILAWEAAEAVVPAARFALLNDPQPRLASSRTRTPSRVTDVGVRLLIAVLVAGLAWRFVQAPRASIVSEEGLA